MLIVCPQCAASYQVAPASLGTDGRSVRCANCHTIWFAEPVAPALEGVAGEAAFDPTAGEADGRADRIEPLSARFPEPADPGIAIENRLADDPADPFPDDTAAPEPYGSMEAVDAPPTAPLSERTPNTLNRIKPLPGEDIESLAARREAEQQRGRWRQFIRLRLRMPGLPVVLIGLGCVILVLLTARQQIVSYAPQTASFYAAIGLPVNLRGLDFEGIQVTRSTQDGVPVLTVEGRIVATAKGIAEVPRLRFAIHDASGREVYAWTMLPSRTLLASGETLPFRSRLASPPAEGQNVSIRFFNHRDAISGVR
jgi:predicted Zn finger-like uncharacterized protein